MSTVDEWFEASLSDDDSEERSRAQEIIRIAGFLAQIRRNEPTCLCGWCATALAQEDVDNAIRLFMNIDIATRESLFALPS